MTSSKITESTIEDYLITLLEAQGFSYIYGPEIAPDSDSPEELPGYRCPAASQVISE